MIDCNKIEEMSKEMGCYACSQGMFDDGPSEIEHPDGVILNKDDEIMDNMMSEENAKIYKSSNENKYIFIRLYNPKYIKFNPSVILKKGIEIVNTNEIFTTHSAIGFNLKDKFYGLTLNSKENENFLKIEECTNLKSNDRMIDCDPEKSLFYIYAIPVTNKEYENCEKLLKQVYNNNDVIYSVSSLFSFVIPSIKRKIHDDRIDGSDHKHDAIIYNSIEDANVKKEKYCCSTFIAAILYKNVKKINDFCIKNHLQPEDFTPSDLTLLPNMYKLFDGKYKDYNKLKDKFIKLNPEFTQYK